MELQKFWLRVDFSVGLYFPPTGLKQRFEKKMNERKLATVRTISELLPIEGADRIELAIVDGWKVVVQKGIYKAGHQAVYLEIDSWVPHDIAPFLTEEGHFPKEYNGIPGQRLRTKKIRGQISQGLLLPIIVTYAREAEEPELPGFSTISRTYFIKTPELHRLPAVKEGDDVSLLLGIQKWERPLDKSVQEIALGDFPTDLVPKTDQERVQNIFNKIEPGDNYEITMKLDGTSTTFFLDEGKLRVCSRNLELKTDDLTKAKVQVKSAAKLVDKLREGFIYQGELIGPNIQGNPEGLSEATLLVFDVWDRENNCYLLPEARRQHCQEQGLEHVPVLKTDASLPETIEELLKQAEGPSLKAKQREGVVYRSNTKDFSFKAISNKWLLKVGE